MGGWRDATSRFVLHHRSMQYSDWVVGKIGMSRGESVVVAVWTISMSDQLPLPGHCINVQGREREGERKRVREEGRREGGRRESVSQTSGLLIDMSSLPTPP